VTHAIQTPTGIMSNEALKDIFKDLHVKITDSLDPDCAINFLLGESVLNAEDHADLEEVIVSENRCRELLSRLHLSSHPEAFVQFRLALIDECSSIVDDIDQRLKSLTVEPKPQPDSSTGKIR